MDTYNIGNYSVVSSLNERTIYIKVVNTLSYMVYEINADSKELRVQGSVSDIYKIVKMCFEQKDKDNYDVSFTVSSGTMKILFIAKIGGFYNIDFELLLREKLMSNDGQLTLAFQRLEQRIEELMDKNSDLTNAIENLYNMEVVVWHYSTTFNSVPLNTIELTINGSQGNTYHPTHVKYQHIALMTNLVKLTFQSGGFDNNSIKQLRNDSVEELTLYHNGDHNFTSIEGLLLRVPRLKYLKIQSAPSLAPQNVMDEIDRSFMHPLKELIFVSCNTVSSQAASLQGFCASRNIKLSIQ